MGKKGGDTRVKRQMAPKFWDIQRKQSQFVLSVNAGAHRKARAYPLGMVLRDVVKVATTMHEAERILNAGKVGVDGIIRRDPNFAVGLMDIISFETGHAYRLVPRESKLLVPIPIEESEKNAKLVRVTSKTTTKGSKVQYGFHDGKSLISDQNLKVGDTCLMEVPEVKIRNHIAFEKGSVALIVTGENAGNIGRIEDIQDGIFSLPKRALVAFTDRSVELPVEMVMVVGVDKPIIKVN